MSYIYNLTDTWNAAGTTFAGIKMAVTNTASSASSNLLDLSVSGATTASFVVNKSGALSLNGSVTSSLHIGGAGTTSTLTLRSTSGVGAAGADIIFQTGNNGATEAMRVLNSGNVGIGGSPATKFHLNGTSNTFRQSYDGSNYTDHSISSNGALTISVTASGDRSVYYSTNTLEAQSNTNTFLVSKTISDNASLSPYVALTKWGSTTLPTPDNSDIGNIVFQGLTTSIGYTKFAQVSCSIAANTASGAPASVLFSTSSGAGDPQERMRIDSNGNVVVNTAAIATNATNGFLYVPTCAGTPTGTPTTYTGRAPIVVNTTDNKLYFYSGGAWRDAGP